MPEIENKLCIRHVRRLTWLIQKLLKIRVGGGVERSDRLSAALYIYICIYIYIYIKLNDMQYVILTRY